MRLMTNLKMARRMTDRRWADDWNTNRRYERTVRFLQETLPPGSRILDLGAQNPFSDVMADLGYHVLNTEGDLDLDYEQVGEVEVDAVTAFEILEHLVAPFNVVRAIRAPKLLATVPLRLWFATAYRNPEDSWDRHYHEFEDWQFDWMLEKAGWHIERREKWTNPSRSLGVRSVLRLVTPRWYAVEASRA